MKVKCKKKTSNMYQKKRFEQRQNETNNECTKDAQKKKLDYTRIFTLQHHHFPYG